MNLWCTAPVAVCSVHHSLHWFYSLCPRAVSSLILFIKQLFTIHSTVLHHSCVLGGNLSELHHAVERFHPAPLSIQLQTHNLHKLHTISKLSEVHFSIGLHCITWAQWDISSGPSLNQIMLPNSTDALPCSLPTLKCTLFARKAKKVLGRISICNNVKMY